MEMKDGASPSKVSLFHETYMRRTQEGLHDYIEEHARQVGEGLQLQLQLEMLKGANEACSGRKVLNPSHQLPSQKEESSCSEDEVEMPDFSEETSSSFSHQIGSTLCSHEDIVSDTESSRSNKLDEFCQLPEASEENTHCLYSVPTNAIKSHGDGFIKYSMTELLDGLQDENPLQRETYKLHRVKKMKKMKRNKACCKRSLCSLGERNIGGDESLSDDDENFHGTVLASTTMRWQAMPDQFPEALVAMPLPSGRATLPVPKSFEAGHGLFSMLQRVMQGEKESDMDFLMNEQMRLDGINIDHHCLVVEIVSRCLDGKLITCCCYAGSSVQELQSHRRKKITVIFNPRVCGNVELEIGSFIMIHHPWKEIHALGSHEDFILTPYFSLVQ